MATASVYKTQTRLSEVERLAADARQQAKLAHERLDRLPAPTSTPVAGPKGERGPRGEASTVPGPKGDKGDSIVGPAGIRGEKGEKGDTVVGPDTAAVLADARAQLDSLRQEVEVLKLVVEAIHGQNKQCDEYINFLRAKTAAKIAARQGN
jgi:hypothetical protein